MSLVLNEIRSLIRNKENDLQFLLDQLSDLQNRIAHNQEVTQGLVKLLERFLPEAEEDGKSQVAYRPSVNSPPLNHFRGSPFPDDVCLDGPNGPRLK